MGQPRRALEDFDEAVRLNPDYLDAYVNRALAYTILDRDEDAREDIARAVQMGAPSYVLDRAVVQAKRRRAHTSV